MNAERKRSKLSTPDPPEMLPFGTTSLCSTWFKEEVKRESSYMLQYNNRGFWVNGCVEPITIYHFKEFYYVTYLNLRYLQDPHTCFVSLGVAWGL